MIRKAYRLLSNQEIEERKREQEKEIKDIVYKEYEHFKKYINFDELPEINDIEILYMKNTDAAVLRDWNNIKVRIHKKFLGYKFPEYLKIILVHEFTHIWDGVVKYTDYIAPNLTEYHAVQIAFAQNIGQENIYIWKQFSENQYVWNYDKRVTAREYIEDLFEDYSYKMEYHYYNESEERTHQFMYNLCQWIGYSIVYEKYCREWNGKRKADIYIPEELEKEINQLYISLRDNHNKKQIMENYKVIWSKFLTLNQINIYGEENYFLRESNKDISVVESFKEHCARIENVCVVMKKKHGTKYVLSRPYLNRRFVFVYFKKMYMKMLDNIKWKNLYILYMEHFILNCPDTVEELNIALREIAPLFENEKFFEVVINRINYMHSVETIIDEDGKTIYRIKNLQSFIEEINYTPSFLAALMKGIADAGFNIQFIEETMVVKRD